MSTSYCYSSQGFLFILGLTAFIGGVVGLFLALVVLSDLEKRYTIRFRTLAAKKIAGEVVAMYYPCTDKRTSQEEVELFWSARIFDLMRSSEAESSK